MEKFKDNKSAERGSKGPFLTGSRQRVLVGGAVFLLFCCLAFVGHWWAQQTSLATLVEFVGSPDRDTSDELGNWFTATVGDDFEDGDGARTPAASLARFQLGNGAKLILKSASQIRFQSRGGKAGAIGLTVEVGEADVRTSDGVITLNSQFGDLVIEPNSLVSLRRDGATMKMSVELGGLEFISVNGEGETRSLRPGDTITLEIGGIILEEGKVSSNKNGENTPGADVEEEVELDPGDGVVETDLVVSAGASFVVHDPAPPTAIGFRFNDICDGPGRLSIGKLQTEALTQGNLRLESGKHSYQLRCLDSPEVVAKSGDVRILKDSGQRKLPSFTPSASVATDGRHYTVMYQVRLPRVTFRWPSAPEAASYQLQVGKRVITTKKPAYTINGLQPGKHLVVFSAPTDPPRKSRDTTVLVKYDSQAPAARVAEPRSGFQPTGPVHVAGRALPGWTVSLNGSELEMDGQRRFSTDVATDGVLPIAFHNEKRGTHYYLRRPGK